MAERDFTGDASKWDRATNSDFQNQVREARENAMANVDASVACTNTTGSVTSDCECQICTGNRAAFAKQQQLARPEEWRKMKGRERARLTTPMRDFRKLTERDRLTDEDFETRFPATTEPIETAPEDLNLPVDEGKTPPPKVATKV